MAGLPGSSTDELLDAVVLASSGRPASVLLLRRSLRALSTLLLCLAAHVCSRRLPAEMQAGQMKAHCRIRSQRKDHFAAQQTHTICQKVHLSGSPCKSTGCTQRRSGAKHSIARHAIGMHDRTNVQCLSRCEHARAHLNRHTARPVAGPQATAQACPALANDNARELASATRTEVSSLSMLAATRTLDQPVTGTSERTATSAEASTRETRLTSSWHSTRAVLLNTFACDCSSLSLCLGSVAARN